MKRLLIVLLLCNSALAVDTKLTALTALTTPDVNDLLYIVDDPAGVPVSKKITRNNLIANWIGTTTITTLGTIASGVWNGTVIGTAYGGTGAAALTDLIALTTHTTGNYVASVAEGFAIDGGAAGSEGTAITIAFDPTEITGGTTWDDGGEASVIWTWNLSAGDPAITFGNAIVNVSTGALQVGGVAVLTASPFGATIDDTEMTAEDFGDFTTTGAEDGFTLDAGVVADNEIDYANVTLADFDYQTAWRVFYSDAAGDVTELALGASGEYLKSNGTTSIPGWAVPGGAGDMTKAVYDVANNGFVDGNNTTYAASWNGNINAASMDAIYDKIEGLPGGHDAVTVVDSQSVNLTLSTQQITADVNDKDYGDVVVSGTGAAWAVDNDSHDHTTTTISGLDISADTNLTAGDGLTLTDDDLDFDGGATPAGDLGGTWADPSVDDDSHAHTTTTISGLDISSDTNFGTAMAAIELLVASGDGVDANTAAVANGDTKHLATGDQIYDFVTGLGYLSTTIVFTNPATGNLSMGDAETVNSITTGDWNICIGDDAGTAITTATGNVLIGPYCGDAIVDGTYNWALGYAAMGNAITPSWSVAIGFDALKGPVAGTNDFVGCIAIGASAGKNTDQANYQIFIGEEAGLGVDVDGTGCVGIGYESLYSLTDASRSVALGYKAGYGATTADDSVYLGPSAGYRQTTLHDILVIDNQDRGSAAAEITDSLIYGVFNPTAANQTLRFNAAITEWGIAVYNDDEMDTYAELNAIVTDVTLTHNGLIDTFAELDAIVADKALVNKADGAVWLGVHDFGGATSIEIPNGANPTVDAEAEMAWETDDNDLHIYDGYRDVVIASKNQSRSFVILNPAATHDFPLWQTPRAITITAVSAICIAGTNVIGQLQEYAADGTTPADVDSSDWTTTTSEYTDTAFTNGIIDAGDWLGWKTTSVSGSVTSFSITFEYYEQ